MRLSLARPERRCCITAESSVASGHCYELGSVALEEPARSTPTLLMVGATEPQSRALRTAPATTFDGESGYPLGSKPSCWRTDDQSSFNHCLAMRPSAIR
jgi:hypothetical protein